MMGDTSHKVSDLRKKYLRSLVNTDFKSVCDVSVPVTESLLGDQFDNSVKKIKDTCRHQSFLLEAHVSTRSSPSSSSAKRSSRESRSREFSKNLSVRVSRDFLRSRKLHRDVTVRQTEVRVFAGTGSPGHTGEASRSSFRRKW